jgi:hypothetical protein
VQELDERPPVWWQPRGDTLRKAVRYPVTSSVSEWGNEVLALDQLINEGFLVAPLRGLAKSLGVIVEDEWRAHKLLEEVLAKETGDHAEAKTVIGSLRRLRELRNHLKGHASDKKQELAKAATTTYGSFRGHFEMMADQLLETLKMIKGIAYK